MPQKEHHDVVQARMVQAEIMKPKALWVVLPSSSINICSLIFLSNYSIQLQPTSHKAPTPDRARGITMFKKLSLIALFSLRTFAQGARW